MSYIILYPLLILAIFLIIMLIRNIFVYNKSMRIHDYIFKRDDKDNYIRPYEETRKLLEQDRSIEMWDDMVWKFWRPINSFYKNTPFEKI